MTVTTLEVADLFDAYAAEAPIHRLVAVLNAQAAQICELQENLRLLQAAQSETLADCKSLRVVFSSLDLRFQATGNDMSALKQCQLAAQRKFEVLTCQLRLKADREELRNATIQAKKSSERLVHTLRNELVSLSFVQCLQTEQKELDTKIQVIERQMLSKMDKSEAARLDGVIVQIHSFRPLATQLSEHLKSVQTQQEQIERSLAQLHLKCDSRHSEQEEIRQHTNDIQQSLNDVETRHQHVVAPQIKRLDDTTEHLHQTLNGMEIYAVKSDTALRTLSAKFHSSAGAFATQLQQYHRHFESAFETRAPRLETESQFAALSRQLATKASDTAHKALLASVKDLQKQCMKLQDHVKLSTRFLDWFARRGEAYEHNLELVETQLGRLAQASHPPNREPFGERVRFPQSP